MHGIRQCACMLGLYYMVTLQAPHYMVSVWSHRFFQPNWSPELKIGYQKQLIGTISRSLVLNLSLDDLFWVSIL